MKINDQLLINSPAPLSSSIRNSLSSFLKNKSLIYKFSKREIIGKYRGSIFGIGWSILQPLFMLTIYTFIFSKILKVQWTNSATGAKESFPLFAFSGMIILNFFSDTIIRSTTALPTNSNYVKKTMFPIDILGWTTVISSYFHLLIGILLLLIAELIIKRSIPLTAIISPFYFIPTFIMLIGLSWILMSAGAYIKDLSQAVPIATTILSFTAPVFYPLESVPASLRAYIYLNPLTLPIEQFREITLSKSTLNTGYFLVYTVIAFIIFKLGYVIFQKSRKGFADVL